MDEPSIPSLQLSVARRVRPSHRTVRPGRSQIVNAKTPTGRLRAAKRSKRMPAAPALVGAKPRQRALTVDQPSVAPRAGRGPRSGTRSPAGAKSGKGRRAKGAYATRYHFHVLGAFRPRGHLLIINKTIHIPLQLSEFLMLFVLACHARTLAKLDAPMAVDGGIYVLPERIVKYIKRIKAGEPGLNDHLNDLNEATVHGAKLRVRQRLQRKNLIEDLLESMRHSGYRISTRPKWIKITLFDDDEGNQTWG